MPRRTPRSQLDSDLAERFCERREQLAAIAGRAGREEAADLVQDAFLKAVEADRRAPIENPLHFLRRVAHNLVVDRLRSKHRWGQVVSPAEAPDVADGRAGPEHALISADRLARALAIIDRMPERRREVFLIHRIDGLTLAQTGARLGISVKTVEKHMTEAMAQLSREIEAR